MLIAAALAGLLIGLALGLLGAGGSILAVPALVYAAGQPLAAAIPASLLIVGVSSAAAVIPRLRTRAVRWPIALVFGAAGIPAAFGGAALGRSLPPRVLLLGFAALMAVVAVRMLTEHRSSGGACRTSGGRINWRACLPKALAAGAVVGVLTGLFGVGGGFLIVPALTLLLGLDAAQAVATSLVIIVINSAAGLAARADAPIDWTTTGIFGGAAVLAALAAGRLATRLPERAVRRGFAYLVLLIAAAIAVTAIVDPATLPTR
ncbi:sulfite exporter TauE/SafE family protein [Amycolatopsis roodepoortensis]|uniref:sulfite exporter TauE/SafE family protein n=1 Tax=Amycolatopsis roodepoortensis TaxID=700274 RepID=UPI00214AB628|nr:sulfite exporter TauE/SafE family protein [Amycolatopsis roodepoortensis]UUV28659.1 sulfite exporter TauE/SafE family protein [Amycolatopsis roodepoortensis]